MACAGGAGVGGLAGQHFVQRATQRVEIAPAVQGTAPPPPAPGSCRWESAPRPDLGQIPRMPASVTARAIPKSATRAWPRDSSTFARLDVAMHDAETVRVAQRSPTSRVDPERVVERQLLLPVQPVAQGLALDIRHDVIE